MKLRVFYISHRLKQTRYEDTREFQDFPSDVDPEAAYAELLTKRGSVMDGKQEVEVLQGQRIKVAPDQFITINSHALVDEKREQVSLDGWRSFEQALPMDFRGCLQDSPELKAKRMKKQRKAMGE